MLSPDTILLEHRARLDTQAKGYITPGIFCDWHALFDKNNNENPHILTFLNSAREAGHQVYVLSNTSRELRSAYRKSAVHKFAYLVNKTVLLESQIKQDKLLELLIDPAPLFISGGAVTLIHPELLDPRQRTRFSAYSVPVKPLMP